MENCQFDTIKNQNRDYLIATFRNIQLRYVKIN